MDIGEHWVYREGKSRPLIEVIVRAVGSNRQYPKVKVEFADDAFEGKTEWVPRNRLKCEWASLTRFRDEEARWEELERDGRPPRGEADAAFACFCAIAPDVIDVYDNLAMGLGEIADVHALADLLGWDSTRLTGSPGSMQRDGTLLVRRLLTREIAVSLARSHPTRIQTLVDDARRERRRRVRARMELLMEYHYMSVEAALDEAQEHFRETGDEPHNHLARWIGYDETALRIDWRELELRYWELRRLVRATLPELWGRRTQKAHALAEEIRRALR